MTPPDLFDFEDGPQEPVFNKPEPKPADDLFDFEDGPQAPKFSAPQVAAPKPPAFTPPKPVAQPKPAAPRPALSVPEQVRQQFVEREAADPRNLSDLSEVFDVEKRKRKAADVAWAEGIGQPVYKGGPLKAGLPRPVVETPETRRAVTRMAAETRAPGAGEAGRRIAEAAPPWLQRTLSAPANVTEWGKETMAVPRTTASGRQVLGSPTYEEQVQLALAAPLLTPLGVADELYRQAKVTMRDVQGLPPASTPEEREGFLPQGDVPALNLGRAAARLPSAAGQMAVGLGEKVGRNIQEEGLVGGIGKTLGLDQDPVRNVWAGEESAAQGEGILESLWRGAKRFPSEAMDILTLPATMGVAAGRQLGKLGDPTFDPGEVMQESAEMVGDVGTGMIRSMARTALDPRKEFEQSPIGTVMNAAMGGAGIRALASKPLERIAKETAELGAKLDRYDAVIEPMAQRKTKTYQEAAAAEESLSKLNTEVRDMEARVEVAEKAGTPIDASAYEALSNLKQRRAQADLDVMAKRQAIEAYEGPSVKTEEMAKGWARVVEKNPLDVKAKAALAEATAKLQAAGVPGKNLERALQSRLSVENRLASKQRLGNVIEAAARVPSWWATLGTSAATDGIGYVARRLGDKFPELRWWFRDRTSQVPPVVMAIERERSAGQTKAQQRTVDIMRSTPLEVRPTLRQFLQAEHSPLEGGYFNPGNDTSRHMFRFRTGEGAVTGRDKYRREQVVAAGKMPWAQTEFERTPYGEMVREGKLDQARALRQRARDLEDGLAPIDDLDVAAVKVRRDEAQARLDDITAQIEELTGIRAAKGEAALTKAQDAAIRAQGADFELGAAKAREADLARGIGARGENKPMPADELQAGTARISALSAELRAAREAATKQAQAEIRQGLSAQAAESIGAAFEGRKAALDTMKSTWADVLDPARQKAQAALQAATESRKATLEGMKGAWADALELARQEAQAAIEATPRGGKGKVRETWDKAIRAERRADELKRARVQGAEDLKVDLAAKAARSADDLARERARKTEDLKVQLAVKAARAAESRAWSQWKDLTIKAEKAQAAADGARLRGELADLNAVAEAKKAAAKAWNDARRSTYRAEVAARSRLEDLSRIEQAAEAAVRRETGLGPSDPMRMGAVPLPKGAEGPTMPRSMQAGPVLARDAAKSREALVGLREEAALTAARIQELDSLAALRQQGRTLPTEAERAAMAKDLRAEAAAADEYVAKMDNEQAIVNRYGRGLAGLSRQYTERAKALGMFENAEQIRDLYWPQLYDEAVRGSAAVPDPIGGMSSAEKAKLAPYLKAGAFRANELRRARVPMTRREAEFGLKTDLAEEAMVGLMGFVDDVEMYSLYDDAAKVPGLTRTPQQFEQMRAAAVAQHNARVAQQYRGNPRLIAENAIDPVTMKGAEDLPVVREWVLVPDEARFPEQARAKLASGGKPGEGLKKYGALGGKYVPADLYFDMVNRRAAMEQMANGLNRLNSIMKAAKTVWSIGTHARNLLSNLLVFAPMAGMSVLNPFNLPHYAAALRDLVSAKKSRMYQMAEQDGVFKGGFGPNELGRNYLGAKLQGAFENVTEPGKRFIEMLADTGKFVQTRGKEARSGAVKAEREMAQKLRDVTDNEAWLRLRKSMPELESTAAGKSALAALKESFSSAMDLPGTIYSASDDLFRLAYYYKNMSARARATGTAPELMSRPERFQVASEARGNFMDYENVPGYASVLRAPMSTVGRSGELRPATQLVWWIGGQPFVSFMARAIPRVKDWLLQDPIRSQMWIQMGDRLTDMNAALSGISREEGEAAKAGYPFASASALKPLGHIVPEWGRDKQGRINIANVGYLSPFSSFTESKASKYDTEAMQAAAFVAELFNIGPPMMVGPLFEQAANRSTFTGRPIVAPGSTPAEEFGQRASHLVQSYLPPITPSMSDVAAGEIGTDTQSLERIRGGTQYEQIAAAVEGVPDYRGRERSVSDALLSLFGGTKSVGIALDDALESEASTVEQYRTAIAETARKATGILVPRTEMNSGELREFSRDYRSRFAPVLKTFRESLARFPESGPVVKLRRGFRVLDGITDDVRWAKRADELLDDVLADAREKAAKSRRIRTDAMRQGAPK